MWIGVLVMMSIVLPCPRCFSASWSPSSIDTAKAGVTGRAPPVQGGTASMLRSPCTLVHPYTSCAYADAISVEARHANRIFANCVE